MISPVMAPPMLRLLGFATGEADGVGFQSFLVRRVGVILPTCAGTWYMPSGKMVAIASVEAEGDGGEVVDEAEMGPDVVG